MLRPLPCARILGTYEGITKDAGTVAAVALNIAIMAKINDGDCHNDSPKIKWESRLFNCPNSLINTAVMKMLKFIDSKDCLGECDRFVGMKQKHFML